MHDTATVDLDGNPATLYDNATSLALATTRRIDQDDEAFSWTAGVNFTLDRNNSLFVRVNSGVKFPGFDNLRDGQNRVQDVDQYELGVKSGTSAYDLYLTAFYNTFKKIRHSRHFWPMARTSPRSAIRAHAAWKSKARFGHWAGSNWLAPGCGWMRNTATIASSPATR